MNKKTFSYIVFIILLLLIIGIDLFFKKNDKYEICQKEEIDATIQEIVKNKKRSISNRMIDSCKNGLLNGGIIGFITGGLPGAASGGILYGLTKPIITFINQNSIS